MENMGGIVVYRSRSEQMVDNWMYEGHGSGVLVPVMVAAGVFVALFLFINWLQDNYGRSYIRKLTSTKFRGNKYDRIVMSIHKNESAILLALSFVLMFPVTKLALKLLLL